MLREVGKCSWQTDLNDTQLMQQKNPSLFYRERVTSTFWRLGGRKKNRAANCLLIKTALEWIMDLKDTLLYRDVEGKPSLNSMADILQQKGDGGNKTKPQINLKTKGSWNAQYLEGASPPEL